MHDNKVRVSGVIESMEVLEFKWGKIVKVVIVQEIQTRDSLEEMPIPFEASGPLADEIFADLHAGDNIRVDGRIRGRRHEERVYGNIRADEVKLLSRVVEGEVVEEEDNF